MHTTSDQERPKRSCDVTTPALHGLSNLFPRICGESEKHIKVDADSVNKPCPTRRARYPGQFRVNNRVRHDSDRARNTGWTSLLEIQGAGNPK